MIGSEKKAQYVGVILVKPDGSVLCQHRDDIATILEPNTWSVPGGTREPYDPTLRSCGARELREETGYDVDEKDLRFLTRDEYVNALEILVQRIIFWAIYDASQNIQCLEGQEMTFISPNEFRNLNFAIGHENFVCKAAEKVFFNPTTAKDKSSLTRC